MHYPLFLLWFFQVIFQPPGIGGWKSYTAFNSISDITYAHNKIWVASEGGLFYFTPGNNDITAVTNAEGLAGNNVTALTVDSLGNVWAGLNNGLLNYTAGPGKKWERIVADPKPFELFDLVASGDRIFLGTGFGISEFIISKKEIKASFRNLGQFPRNTPVYRLWLDGETLWAGTDLGIARASINAANLQDPQFWTNYSTSEGLPSKKVRGFARIGGNIFTATSGGVARWSNGIWIVDGLSGTEVWDLSVQGNALYAGTEYNVYRRDNSGLWSQVGSTRYGVVNVFSDPSGKLWIGSRDEGLFSLNENQNKWESVSPNSPAGNSFASMAVDQNEVLWVAAGNSGNKGLYRYDGKTWNNFREPQGLPAGNVTSVTVDATNRIWCGTPGRGAFVFSSPDGLLIQGLAVFDSTKKRLTGSDTPNFIIVDDIAVDGNGVVWLLNRFANNGRAVVAVKPGKSWNESEWNYFSTGDGLVSNQVSAITFDDKNNVWIGTTDGSGLSVLNYKGTLSNKTDDLWTTYRTIEGLSDNSVNYLTKDRLGYIWIATPNGINYWDGTKIRVIFGLIDSYVNTILVDPSNNKWFGTNGGLSMVDRDNYKWAHYTTGNSPLVDEQVLSLAMNEKTGDLYIGTGKGLSYVHTPFNNKQAGGNALVGFPNPFLLSETDQLIIGSVEAGSTVKVYTSTGRLVRSLTEEKGEVAGSQAFWDGKDTDKKMVGSGIYIIVAYTHDGEVRKGKVAVIRP